MDNNLLQIQQNEMGSPFLNKKWKLISVALIVLSFTVSIAISVFLCLIYPEKVSELISPSKC
jgi:hypothetical protein